MFSTDFLQIEIGIYFVVSDPLIFINIDMPFLYQIWCKFVVHICVEAWMEVVPESTVHCINIASKDTSLQNAKNPEDSTILLPCSKDKHYQP